MTSYLNVIISRRLDNSITLGNVIHSRSSKSTVNYCTDANMKLQFVSCHTAQKTATRPSSVMTSQVLFPFLRYIGYNLKIDCLNVYPNTTTKCCCTSTVRTAGHDPCQESNRGACARFRSERRVPTTHLKLFAPVQPLTTHYSKCLMFSVCL
jgi:hypothetical protein